MVNETTTRGSGHGDGEHAGRGDAGIDRRNRSRNGDSHVHENGNSGDESNAAMREEEEEMIDSFGATTGEGRIRGHSAPYVLSGRSSSWNDDSMSTHDVPQMRNAYDASLPHPDALQQLFFGAGICNGAWSFLERAVSMSKVAGSFSGNFNTMSFASTGHGLAGDVDIVDDDKIMTYRYGHRSRPLFHGCSVDMYTAFRGTLTPIMCVYEKYIGL